MFSTSQDDNSIAITLELTTGERLKGLMNSGITKKLSEAPNRSEPFIELLRSDGTIVMIAKSIIAQVEPAEPPRINQLDRRLADESMPDPHKVLGVDSSASATDIQNAYHTLARRYHPDHFSGREIPPEVLNYVSAMFKRITIAYNELRKSPADDGADAA